ncbi:MAG TPA: hypothetical protein VLC11_04350 [Gemmatimonadales bacterium]|nr:hypothetical protein [Gemmatimonadales bacterium]
MQLAVVALMSTPKMVEQAGKHLIHLPTITSNPGNALIGAGFLAIGVPVCLFWRNRSLAR